MHLLRDSTIAPTSWPQEWAADVAQLLDEHHVVVVCDDVELQERFARMLESHFASLPRTQLIHISGADARSSENFAAQLSRAASDLTGRAGLDGMVQLLRTRGSRLRQQIFLWHQADAMLEADVEEFSRVANALMAVAAERELLGDDTVVIQRAIFMGGPKLGAYAEWADGQFSRWRDDGRFNRVLRVAPRPKVLLYRIGE